MILWKDTANNRMNQAAYIHICIKNNIRLFSLLSDVML